MARHGDLIFAREGKGAEFVGQEQEYYEEHYRERVVHQLSQRAAKLGMKMVAIKQS